MNSISQKTIGPLDVLISEGDPGGIAIILFHGFGADAHDLYSLSSVYQGSPRPTWIFPNAPLEISIAPGFKGRAWFPIDFEMLYKAKEQNNMDLIDNAFPQELKEARQIGESCIGELQIPLSKIFLGGFSQGAVLATEIALHAFENPAGLILLSGTLVNRQVWGKLAHLRGGMPFFQSHGIEDPLLPFARAESLETLLIEGGLRGKLHAFSGGHEIPPKTLKELTHFFEKVTFNKLE